MECHGVKSCVWSHPFSITRTSLSKCFELWKVEEVYNLVDRLWQLTSLSLQQINVPAASQEGLKPEELAPMDAGPGLFDKMEKIE